MGSLPWFRRRSLFSVSWRARRFGLWSWCFSSRGWSSFRFTCQLQHFLRRCVQVTFVVTGIGFALANCGAEWLYTEGFNQTRPDYLRLAGQLFPFDVRFRWGLAEVVLETKYFDDRTSIAILEQARLTDPYAPILIAGIMARKLAIGDYEGADREFAELNRLAPKSAIVQRLLAAQRREP